MGSFKMRLLLIATSLALVAAAPHSEDRQKWRPAQGRDMGKYKPKLPEVAFGTPTPTAPRTKPFEFKKGNKSFAEECGLENPNGVEDRIVGGHEAAHHEWPLTAPMVLGTLTSWPELTMFAPVLSRTGSRSPPSRARPTLSGTQTASMPTLLSSICQRRLPSASTSGPRVSHRPPMQMKNTLGSCADYYGSIIYSGIMCIDAAGGKGVCNGDSGGTLNIRQTEGGNKWTQVGVTSFVSSAGCESGNPHGFSRVAEHLEWIETVTGLSLTQ